VEHPGPSTELFESAGASLINRQSARKGKIAKGRVSLRLLLDYNGRAGKDLVRNNFLDRYQQAGQVGNILDQILSAVLAFSLEDDLRSCVPGGSLFLSCMIPLGVAP
jgi:hypothetical protein